MAAGDKEQLALTMIAQVTSVDPVTGQLIIEVDNYVWDPIGLAWAKMTQPGGGGGGAATIADGADVTEGAIADAAVTGDNPGTVNAHLRGITKQLSLALPLPAGAATEATLAGRLKPADTLTKVTTVDTITNPVAITAAALPLPAGAATEATLAGRLKPADTLAAVTSITNPITANGDVDHDAVNTLKNIQVAGNANPVDAPPTAVSAVGDRAREYVDRYGSPVIRLRKIRESYTAVCRLAEAAARLDQTFTHVANTNKQWATLHHLIGATKEVRLQSCVVWITNMTTVAPQGILELRQINAAPVTGNPAIIPTPHRRGGTAAEAVCLYLPTTAGTEANADRPLGHHIFDEAVSVATVGFAHPQGYSRGGIVLYDRALEDDEMMQPVLPVATLDGWAVVTRLTGATVMRATVVWRFTEEVP